MANDPPANHLPVHGDPNSPSSPAVHSPEYQADLPLTEPSANPPLENVPLASGLQDHQLTASRSTVNGHASSSGPTAGGARDQRDCPQDGPLANGTLTNDPLESRQVLPSEPVEHNPQDQTDPPLNTAVTQTRHNPELSNLSGIDVERAIGPSPVNSGVPRRGELSHHYTVQKRINCINNCGEHFLSDTRPLVDGTIARRESIHPQGTQCLHEPFSSVLDRRPESFIIYQYYTCVGDSRGPNRRGEVTECISPITQALEATLDKIADCEPDDNPLDSEDRNSCPRPARSYGARFLYHHYRELNDVQAQNPERGGIAALLDYLAHDAASTVEFSACDRDFGASRVSCGTLPWLFRPNEVVVTTRKDGPYPVSAAYVVGHWPVVSKSGLVTTVTFRAWNWIHDGRKLRRRYVSLQVSVPAHGTVEIRKLDVYPLRYADEQMKAFLTDLGRRFWALREPGLVAYEGWDWERQKNYVSEHGRNFSWFMNINRRLVLKQLFLMILTVMTQNSCAIPAVWWIINSPLSIAFLLNLRLRARLRTRLGVRPRIRVTSGPKLFPTRKTSLVTY